MKKFTPYYKGLTGTMILCFIIGIIALSLHIEEAGAIFFIMFLILFMVWGPCPDSEKYTYEYWDYKHSKEYKNEHWGK